MSVVTTGCSGFAEVVIEGAPPAMCAAGMYTLNPGLCGPWFWLASNPHYKELFKKATELGCDVVVQAGPTHYKIVIRETRNKTRHAKEIYNTLDSVQGIRWLMRKLSGY